MITTQNSTGCRCMHRRSAVVTGAKGQLGTDVVQRLRDEGYNVYGFGKEELDILDLEQCREKLRLINPCAVVHCAAYTKVDRAEQDVADAYVVNAIGTRNIAVVSREIEAKIVYISTDYVFNGESRVPYDEFSATSPINVYGRSKRAGEQFVERFNHRHFVVRTSWVYGLHGDNFVKTMLRLAREQGRVAVVNDQTGCPTYTKDLAETIARFIRTEKYGTYHVSNSGSCTWYEFAEEIFKQSNVQAELLPISTEQFVRPAARPNYSVLKPFALELNGFPEMRHWKDALTDFIAQYHEKQVIPHREAAL